MKYTATVLALLILTAVSADGSVMCGPGNLGYNSYNGYLTRGAGLKNYFGPGVGYGVPSGTFGDYQNAGDYFRRYVPPGQWGRFGYGTGHLGQGYGPYIFGRQNGPPPPGMNDPLPGAYEDAPAPKIKVGRGLISVSLPRNLPGVRCVTVTILAFNGAELTAATLQQPPWLFTIPVMDGCKNVRVRIDYVNSGLSATSYPL
ncbi:MAG: hypothetical protein NT018_06215 [Armatimonadetes bacterium]|nr:hypothetical protein [Armatimonadota bacterium]